MHTVHLVLRDASPLYAANLFSLLSLVQTVLLLGPVPVQPILEDRPGVQAAAA